MKNAMQLKATMKNIAKQKNISAQLVLQNYMMERFLERVSLSDYREKFILKGGFLISSIVGLDSRATMDMDITIKGYPVNIETIQKMIQEIIAIDINDNIMFSFNGISQIREKDEYMGYRVALLANYSPMAVPLKLDITTGDIITPREIEYEYKLMMEERSIKVLAYNMTTILAEKLETVISRGNQNTRPRDYYDIYILAKLYSKNIDFDTLAHALWKTSQKRGSTKQIAHYREIIDDVRKDDFMKQQWEKYRSDFEYASGIEFDETCDTVISLMNRLPKT